MKKFALILCSAILMGASTFVSAEEKDTTKAAVAQMVDTVKKEEVSTVTKTKTKEVKIDTGEKIEKKEIREIIKQKFIEGGVGFMSIVLICLIFGLAISIERIIMLSLASTNVDSLVNKLEDALNRGGVDEAKLMLREVPGPVAAIFTQGLKRTDEGLEGVEKAVMAYGSVEMGKLEKGLTWISLFISLAPMLGFMGTVIGMIQAFESIVTAGTIEIDQVAKGIQVALLTTVAGLIVAIILQVFYNYIVSKIDEVVNQMEEGSVSLIDSIITHQLVNKKD
jgi:biopolymer transport protein ExbB